MGKPRQGVGWVFQLAAQHPFCMLALLWGAKTRRFTPRPYGFMLKKSLMPSEETGLGPLFFSAEDLSLVQVSCTFSGSASPSPSGSSPGDGELLGQLGALWSWISCTCGMNKGTAHDSFGGQRLCSRWMDGAAPPPLHTSSSGFSSLSPAVSSGTLRRSRVLAGFFLRIEPRDSSVILWI